jgi:hypothetical protein
MRAVGMIHHTLSLLFEANSATAAGLVLFNCFRGLSAAKEFFLSKPCATGHGLSCRIDQDQFLEPHPRRRWGWHQTIQ